MVASAPMDSRTLVAEIVKALAWPVASVILVLVVRRPILGVLEGLRLTRFKRGEFEAEFDERVREVRRELPAAPNHPEPAAVQGMSAALAPVLEAYPATAIAEAWNLVERELGSLSERAGTAEHSLVPILNELVNKKVIDSRARDSIIGLSQLRNLSVHRPPGELSPERAREFVTMADAMLWLLRDAQRKTPST